jgi:hypothetical protein
VIRYVSFSNYVNVIYSLCIFFVVLLVLYSVCIVQFLFYGFLYLVLVLL